MNSKLQYKNIALEPQVQILIERRAKKERRMLPSYRSHDRDLHVNLERKSSSKQFQATLVLTTPQTSIRVRDTEATAPACVTRVFDKLIRKISKLKSQLNRERFWHKDVKRTAGPEPGSDLRELEDSINANLDRIKNYIRRELFYLAASKPFAPESIQPQEVVDEIFYEVSAHLENRPAHLNLKQWMFQLALERVRKRARQASSEDRYEVDSEDEIFHYYHPHEGVKFLNLLKKEGCSGEKLAKMAEVEEQIEAFIAHLSAPVREAFVLNVLEDFGTKEVAAITGQNPVQVDNHVNTVRGQLRVQFCS